MTKKGDIHILLCSDKSSKKRNIVFLWITVQFAFSFYSLCILDSGGFEWHLRYEALQKTISSKS